MNEQERGALINREAENPIERGRENGCTIWIHMKEPFYKKPLLFVKIFL